jgi:putative transposase
MLGLARSTRYYTSQGEDVGSIALMHVMDELYTEHPSFGSRSMTSMLNRMGYSINRKRIQRLMQVMGIEAIYPKPHLSAPDKQHPIFPYLLRHMVIERVNQVWSCDITFIRLEAGYAYLVAFLDWFSRYVLSFALSTTLDNQFCIAALKEALAIARPDICNTDQGSQFTAQDFVACVLGAGVRVSMDGRGRALDNVFVERLWRSVKYEDVYLRDYQVPKDALRGLTKYFGFYNNERPHQSLGNRTPAEVFYACS